MPLGATSETIVSSNTANDQDTSDIQALSNGNYIVAWRSLDGSAAQYDYDLHSRVFNSAGVAIGADTKFTDASLEIQTHPSIASLAKGKSVAVWFSKDPSSTNLDFGPYSIYGRILNKQGAPIGTQFKVNTTDDTVTSSNGTFNDQELPTVTSLASGKFVVVWESAEAATASKDIRGRIFDASGKPQGKDFLINTTTVGAQRFAEVTALKNGGFVATWSSADNNSLYDVHARFYSAKGTPAGKEIIVNTHTTNNHVVPVVKQLASGNVVVSWITSGATDTINAKIFNSSGGAITGELQLNTTTSDTHPGNERAHVDVTALADGRFMVIWDSVESGSTEIRARVFLANGTALGTDFLVNANTVGGQSDPHATLLANGKVAVSFTTYENGSNTDVHTKILDPYTFIGTSADEFWVGSKIKDTLIGNDGSDILVGLKGKDYIDGGTGNDVLSGGKDNDVLIGGIGADDMTGGSGNDKFKYMSVSDGGDTIHKFAAGDTLVFDSFQFGFNGVKGALPKAAFFAGTAAHDIDDHFIYDKPTGQLWFDSDGVGESSAVLIATLDNHYKLTATDIKLDVLLA